MLLSLPAFRWSFSMCVLDGAVRFASAQGPTSAGIGGRVLEERGAACRAST
jgi:hypothetical protein